MPNTVWKRPQVLLGTQSVTPHPGDAYEGANLPLHWQSRLGKLDILALSKRPMYLQREAIKTKLLLRHYLLNDPNATVLLHTAATDLLANFEWGRALGEVTNVQIWATGYLDAENRQLGANVDLDPYAAELFLTAKVNRYLVPQQDLKANHRSFSVLHKSLREKEEDKINPLLDVFASVLKYHHVAKLVNCAAHDHNVPLTSDHFDVLSAKVTNNEKIDFPLVSFSPESY